VNGGDGVFLVPLLRRPDIAYLLRNERTRAVLATRLETAFDARSRRRGLLGRSHLDEGAALIIAPCNAIHTFFMRFPIDVLFAAKDGRVVGLRQGLAPWRVAASLRARAVVECPAGVIRASRTELGDLVEVVAAELQ
jgi:uncharacterized membrane protein (UPF0127 family)